MRYPALPASEQDTANAEAFRTALAAAAQGLARLAVEWERVSVTVPPNMLNLTRTALIAAAFARTPRHRQTPHPSDVVHWLNSNAGGDLAGVLTLAYADQLGTRVLEMCMRRTRDNGVRVLRPGWIRRIVDRRRHARRRAAAPHFLGEHWRMVGCVDG